MSKIVISDEHHNQLRIGGQCGHHPELQELETSFILKTTSGVPVGRGTYET